MQCTCKAVCTLQHRQPCGSRSGGLPPSADLVQYREGILLLLWGISTRAHVVAAVAILHLKTAIKVLIAVCAASFWGAYECPPLLDIESDWGHQMRISTDVVTGLGDYVPSPYECWH